jgi:hypothetical protein
MTRPKLDLFRPSSLVLFLSTGGIGVCAAPGGGQIGLLDKLDKLVDDWLGPGISLVLVGLIYLRFLLNTAPFSQVTQYDRGLLLWDFILPLIQVPAILTCTDCPGSSTDNSPPAFLSW